MKTHNERMAFVKQENVGLYICALKAMGQNKEFQQHITRCKESPDEYTTYAVFYLPFYFNELEKLNKLKQGKQTLTYSFA